MNISPVIQLNGWNIEFKLAYLRKCDKYGETYSGVATANFLNGVAYVELLHSDEFTRIDYTTVRQLLNTIGFDNIQFIRKKPNGQLEKKAK